MKILIVEDELELTESVLAYLQKEKYLCEIALDYATAMEKVNLYDYDILVIDLNLPDGNGLNLIKYVKKQDSEKGIIITSAKNTLDDRIAGLNAGADDYLVKPYFLAELNARIRSLVRRISFKGMNNIIFNEIRVDPYQHQAFVNDELLDLTKKEYDLLLFLITNKGRVLSKESIAEHLWGDYMDGADSFDVVYTHIKNLRKKLIDKGLDNYLQTVYGVGYKFSEF